MKKPKYIDIHAIQTVPPSCINRDDTGAPKTAIYGGVERARVSSQAWKRAMREYFKENFPYEENGIRTQQLPSMIASAIMDLDSSFSLEEAMNASMEILKTLSVKVKEEDGNNAALFFVSKAQVRALAKLKVEGETKKEAYERALIDNPTDIALFGRTVAGASSLNYDAAVQVAHAISTHKVQIEYDYFSAVDDIKVEGNSGAVCFGTTAFYSATFYRYATVNITELATNLGHDTAKAVRDFVEAFTYSMPTGKQNTFANRTLPDMLYVTMRLDQPVYLSEAFKTAINGEEGYAKESCEKLLTYAEEMYANYAAPPALALGCGDTEILSGHAETMPMNTLLDRVEEYVATSFGEDTI